MRQRTAFVEDPLRSSVRSPDAGAPVNIRARSTSLVLPSLTELRGNSLTVDLSTFAETGSGRSRMGPRKMGAIGACGALERQGVGRRPRGVDIEERFLKRRAALGDVDVNPRFARAPRQFEIFRGKFPAVVDTASAATQRSTPAWKRSRASRNGQPASGARRRIAVSPRGDSTEPAVRTIPNDARVNGLRVRSGSSVCGQPLLTHSPKPSKSNRESRCRKRYTGACP